MNIYSAYTNRTSPRDAVRMLLEHALKLDYDLNGLPLIHKTEQGKPYFPGYPDIHFSLSHSGKLVLCVIDSDNCGCDIQEFRQMSDRLLNRCFSQEELKHSSPIDLWCLKESFIKYRGAMDRPYKQMEFLPHEELFLGPDNTIGKVFHLTEGYSAALICSAKQHPPSEIQVLSLP